MERWWFPAAPVLFLVGCGLINLLILMHDPVPAVLGLLVVLCGDLVRRLFFSTPKISVETATEQSVI